MNTRPWSNALVTGASSGLGDALARRLAADGVDVVAVARDVARLERLSGEAGPGAVEVLPADLTTTDGRALVAARLAADERAVDLAIANAGVWQFGDLVDQDPATLRSMIELNVVAVVELTHAAVTAMRRRGGGAVVLISSIAGNQPLAHEAVYGASKAFVSSFGQAVAEELRGSDVSLTTIMPGLVRTELHERVGGSHHVALLPDRAWMDADVVAASIIEATAAHRVVHTPGFVNRVVSSLTDMTPRAISRRAAATVNRKRR
ncbi:MAG: SDR family NAD(P)-dependent oxidoreductase [Acidimicrobiales bacterium]